MPSADPRRDSATPRPIASQSRAIAVVPVAPQTAPWMMTMATFPAGGIGATARPPPSRPQDRRVAAKQRTRFRLNAETNGESQATRTGVPVIAK